MSRSRPALPVVWMICLVTGFSVLWGAYSVGAKETLDQRRARIESMDATRTAALERARKRFAALDPGLFFGIRFY